MRSIAVYTLDPLRTPSHDPRLRVLGFKLYRVPTHGMEPKLEGGSTIEIVDGVTSVDGRPLREPCLGGVVAHRDFSRTMSRVRLPPQSFFVMGDNRDDSYDSRMFGAVSRSEIIAKRTKN
jgi:Signal peptidase, peptidase S26